MSNLTGLTISEMQEGLSKKKLSSEEIIQESIKNAKKYQNLKAFIYLNEEKAIKDAKKSDEMIRLGKARKLEGIPIAIKDLFCTKGERTTACSKMLENFVPNYESTVTNNLLLQGAINFGKTNMDEFAMGSTTTNSYFGPSINPWTYNNTHNKNTNPQEKIQNKPNNSNSNRQSSFTNSAINNHNNHNNNNGNTTKNLWTENINEQALVAGGSSGGSAVAVATNIVPASLGSDTGGSVRQPASFCGIVGAKPTYGRCSRWGMIAFASSLDQAGVFANNVKDAAIVLETVCGYDPKDSSSTAIKKPNILDNLNANSSIKGKKIGIPKEYLNDDLNQEIIEMWKEGENYLKDQGAEIVHISLPNTSNALAVYYILGSAEMSSNLQRYDGIRYGYRTKKQCSSLKEMIENTRGEAFGKEVKRRIMIGTYVLSAQAFGQYYIQAQKVRSLIIKDFISAFKKIDAILVPTTPTSAFPIVQKEFNPIDMYLNDIFTVPASVAGLPAVSIPTKLSKNKGLPLGLQVICNYYNEVELMKFALAIEKAANFPKWKDTHY